MADETEHATRPGVPMGPVAAWLAVQLAALALSAGRVPLSARFPRVAEELAVDVMLVAQVTAASLLFPLLLRDARALAVAVLTALPFLQLAGYLAGTPTPRLARAAAYLVVWLIALGLWRRALSSRAAALYGVAVASAIAVGGPILWYARAEFARHSAAVDWPADGALGPILGALAQVEHPAIALAPWFALGTFALAGGAAALVRAARNPTKRTTRSG
jgi:hypothetical protein